MNITKRTRVRIFTLLVAAMLVLAGCQSVSGLDLNKAMMSQLVTESLEGRLEISLDLEIDDTLSEWTDPESVAVARALSGMKIVLAEIKQEDLNTASIKGSLVVSRGEIPFHAYVDKSRLLISFRDAGPPIEISLDGADFPMGSGLYGGGLYGGGFESFNSRLQDKELLEALGSLLFKHLDNPKNLSVQRVFEPVNGQNVSMYKVHAEVAGPEMMELFGGLLSGLVQDDEGLKKVVALIYDAIAPQFEEMGIFGFPFGKNRDLDIELMHTSIKQMMLFMLIAMQEEDSFIMSGIRDFFTEETGIVADLYFDGSLNLRKADYEVNLAPNVSEWDDDSGVRAVKLKMSGEYWNHNRPVQAELPEDAEQAYSLIDPDFSGDEWLRQLNKQSVLYKWLKEDLKAMRKSVSFTLVPEAAAEEPVETIEVTPVETIEEDGVESDADNATEPAEEDPAVSVEDSAAPEDEWDWELEWDEWWWYPLEHRPLMIEGTMVVPARYYADSLGLRLEWNGITQEVTLTGGDPETVIVLTVDSSIATVNGTEQEMGVPVILQNGQAYIPLRFVSEALGAEIEWVAEENTAIVTLDF